MPVRPTENRIPTGLNPEDLGQAVENGDLKLISYLTEPLKYEEDKKPIRNTYVVFDTRNINNTSNPNEYRWKFAFKVEGQNDPIELTDLEGVEGGSVFNLNSSEGDFEDALEGKKVTKVTTTVTLDAAATIELELEQKVEDLDGTIEDLIENFDNEKGANAGEPNTTRKLANDYKDYLIELGKDKGEQELEKVSLNLLATLLYHAIESDPGIFSRLSEYLFGPDEEDWMNYANSEGSVEHSDLVGSKIGICNIKPHIFHYLSKSPPGPNKPYKEYIFDANKKVFGELEIDNEIVESLDKYDENALSELDPDNNSKIDLFNTFQFPKSCLYTTWMYLKNIKERHNEYLSKILDKTNHPTNRECISTVVTEFETAPNNNMEDASSTAMQAYDVMYSKWMQAILDTSKIQMEVIKIKVLDIRSGKPIKNERVRRLLIKSNDKVVETNFEENYGNHNWVEDVQGNTPQHEYQFALIYLGYNSAAMPGQYFDNLKIKYQEFWDDRIIGNTNQIPAGTNHPPGSMQKEIINEYKMHSRTDDEGILNVRAHRSFFENRQVSIFISFLEFPIAYEELGDDSRDDPITRSSTNEENNPTEFQVSWVGGTGANQKIDWTDYVDANHNFVEAAEFGWNVSKDDLSSKIKSVQRLIVKDDESVFDGYDTDLLSKFYDSDSYPIHFVLFGMVWCQPVWDDCEDASSGAAGAITENTYIQNPMYTNFHMHIVTMPYDFTRPDPNVCTDIYGGKGYGKYETDFGNSSRWRNIDPPYPAHQGYDIHAKLGDNVFAFHGGTAENIDNGDHIMCKITWSSTLGYKRISYLHLSAHVACAAVDEVNVIAGQVTARSGRTGDFPDISSSHVHINVGTINDLAHKYLPRLTETLRDHYPENEKCIPNNDFPLSFPCACEVINPDPENCNFSNLNFLRDCWAAAELKCPYIDPDDVGNIKLQVQLRHIKQITNADPGGFTDDDNNNPEYFNPGGVDGVILPVNVNNVGTADLTNGTVVVRLGDNRHGGRLIKIRHTQNDGQIKDGWIESSLINAANQLAIPALLGVTELSSLLQDPVGSTRMAIYFFRKANSLLDFTDYASNFNMDDSAWTTLNVIAPITTPE